MNSKQNRGKQIMDDIRKVLYNEWDPHCVKGEAPYDEYDCCIAPIYRMLTQKPTVEEMVGYLATRDAEDVSNKEDKLMKVALKLLEIDVSIRQ